jgi:hypothetical protein
VNRGKRGTMAETEGRSWLSRHVAWLAPTVVLSAVALFAGLAFVALQFFFGLMKSCEACQEAIARAKANPSVQAALGTPVEDGLFVTGKISLSGTSGSADVRIPLSGPKGKAGIFVVASRSGGIWSYSTLVVAVDGTGERIDLQAGVPAEAAPTR